MGWSAPKFHMLGNGVGANLAAVIARKIVKLYPSTGTRPFQVEKITALDPFMPTNYPCGRIERLNLDDANIVDIIHTSSLSSEYFGNVNFYPNGNDLILINKLVV